MFKNITDGNKNAAILILVAALGYFVDIYDLILFNVVKKESLEHILPYESAEDRTRIGIFLFNMQMTGMLIGGVLWGIWGDKKGRLSVLFGSILLYSLANIANAMVTSIPAYIVVRLIAGIGLAGELGAGITLVSEVMSKEKRGYGTMIIVTFGALGAVFAALVGAEGHQIGTALGALLGVSIASWQVAYITGGMMGLLLLILRLGTIESGMFKNMQKRDQISKGDFRILFKSRKHLRTYLSCIFVGVPIWFIIGLLVANSQEIFAPDLGIQDTVINGTALMFAYLGLSFGDLISGLLSQFLKSRKKVIYLYLAFALILVLYFLLGMKGATTRYYYVIAFLLGTASGYWAIFVTVASEQFGTNIRSTVTNTVPNFVRGSVPLITLSFGWLMQSAIGSIHAALIVALVCFAVAFLSNYFLEETFGKDLNYYEN